MKSNKNSYSKSTTIELLPTRLARLSSLAHPVLLLSAYYAQFPRLVLEPILGLLNFLLPLVAIQITYAVICLPRAGLSFTSPESNQSYVNNVTSATQGRGGTRAIARKKKKPAKTPPSRILTIFLALILTGFSVPLLTVIQILFGAPFISHLPHTVLSSTHLSLLSLFPLIYVHGTDSEKWRQIISVYCPLDEIFGATIGAFIGSWLGAIPIPLDWDRAWQKWPITIVTGMYLGYVIGKFAGGKVFKGKKVELD